jgi:hypothetical protein
MARELVVPWSMLRMYWVIVRSPGYRPWADGISLYAML